MPGGHRGPLKFEESLLRAISRFLLIRWFQRSRKALAFGSAGKVGWVADCACNRSASLVLCKKTKMVIQHNAICISFPRLMYQRKRFLPTAHFNEDQCNKLKQQQKVLSMFLIRSMQQSQTTTAGTRSIHLTKGCQSALQPWPPPQPKATQTQVEH